MVAELPKAIIPQFAAGVAAPSRSPILPLPFAETLPVVPTST